MSSPTSVDVSASDDLRPKANVCDLPPEIVGRIMHISNEPPNIDLILERRRLSLVCRYFRAVALSTTELWTNINLFAPNLAYWQLQRCGTALLHLDADMKIDPPEDFGLHDWWYDVEIREAQVAALWMHVLKHHAHQIGSVHFSFERGRNFVTEDIFTPALEGAECISFPHLSRLDINCDGYGTSVVNTFFKHSLPAVAHLRMSTTWVSVDGLWTSKPSSVQTLCSNSSDIIPPLQRMSNLVELEIVARTYEGFPRLNARAVLPALRKLVVEGGHHQIHAFLDQVETPALTTAQVTRLDQDLDCMVDLFESVIDRIFGAPGGTSPVRSLDYVVSTHFDWQFRIQAGYKTVVVSTKLLGISYRSDTQQDYAHEHLVPLLAHLQGASQTITTLGAYARPNNWRKRARVWSEAFDRLQNVAELEVDPPSLGQLLEKWMSAPDYLPTVQTIHINAGSDAPGAVFHVVQAAWILPAFKTRVEAAEPIQRITLAEGGSIGKKIVRSLRRDFGMELLIRHHDGTLSQV
jgi:hypothetical protein